MKKDYVKGAIIGVAFTIAVLLCTPLAFVAETHIEVLNKVQAIQNYVKGHSYDMEKMTQSLNDVALNSGATSTHIAEIHEIMGQMAKHVVSNTKMSINTFKHLIKPRPPVKVMCKNNQVMAKMLQLQARTQIIIRNQLLQRDILDHILGELSDLRRYTVMVPIPNHNDVE